MLRRLFTFLSAVSLLFLIAAALLWITSYKATVMVRFHDSAGVQWQCVSEQGVIWMDNGLQVDAERSTLARILEKAHEEMIFAQIPKHPPTQSEYAALEAEYEAQLKAGIKPPPSPAEVHLAEYEELKKQQTLPHQLFHVHCKWVISSLAVLPIAYLSLTATQRRRLRMLANAKCCLACGYDLRATPTRCPECGAIPAMDSSR